MSAADDRQELARRLVQLTDSAAALRMEAARFDEEAARAAAELQKLMVVGETLRVDDVEVVLAPPRPVGRRSVDVDGMHRYIEDLAPIGLAPWEEPQPPRTRYPSVSAIEAKRHQLARVGVPLDALISAPPLGEAQVVIRQRQEVSA